VVTLAGARVAYRAGTSLRVGEGDRRVDLDGGEVDVEVTPGGPGRFRVYAPGFIVEVVGTRFIVGADGVRTLHGRVRILDLRERELAVVSAGESWSPGPSPAASAALPSAAAVIPSPARATVRHEAVSRRAARSEPPAASPPPEKPESSEIAAALVDQAHRDLAGGDVAGARARLAEAQATARSLRVRASIDLLGADALLVEKRRPEAIAAYRRVAAEHADLPEGEMACFAVAEILCEGGTDDQAREALERYLERYPQGRFVREVNERLRSLSAAAAP
jgi:hypothetical protein